MRGMWFDRTIAPLARCGSTAPYSAMPMLINRILDPAAATVELCAAAAYCNGPSPSDAFLLVALNSAPLLLTAMVEVHPTLKFWWCSTDCLCGPMGLVGRG